MIRLLFIINDFESLVIDKRFHKCETCRPLHPSTPHFFFPFTNYHSYIWTNILFFYYYFYWWRMDERYVKSIYILFLGSGHNVMYIKVVRNQTHTPFFFFFFFFFPKCESISFTSNVICSSSIGRFQLYENVLILWLTPSSS